MKENIIDTATIESIKKLQKPGRPDLLKELIDLFIRTTADYIKILRASVINKDLGTLAHIAHSFKSSAANLGALKLSEACFELEKIGNGDASPERLNEIFNRTEIAYIEAVEQLKNF